MSCLVEVSNLTTQPSSLIQQCYVEVVRGVHCLGKGTTVPLHGLCPETEKAKLGFTEKKKKDMLSPDFHFRDGTQPIF